MDGKTTEEPPSTNDDDSKKELQQLKIDMNKMREEFNVQRAKMKDLYLQKEGECLKLNEVISSIKNELDESKSQILLAEYRSENVIQTQDRKAQEEIASLQHLIQETIEESSQSKGELYKLHQEYERLKMENHELRDQQQQESTSLAPVLSHVKKTIARKLGADTTTPVTSVLSTLGTGGAQLIQTTGITSSQDNLDDSMRKAQEDAEMLRSLVVPLEEEIKALKEKLRSTDDELQKYGKGQISQSALVGMINEKQELTISSSASALTTTQTGTPQKLPNDDKPKVISKMTSTELNVNDLNELINKKCVMCDNYEQQLVQLQKQIINERKENQIIQQSIERMKEELNKEGVLRQELELQWQEKRDIHKDEVQQLNIKLKKTEQQFLELNKNFIDLKKDIHEELMKLTDEREQLNRHLDMLQRDNDILSGKYIQHSQQLQNQEINLPNNVDELQERLLTIHEYLIEAKIGCEHAEQEMVALRDESQLLRQQLTEQKREASAKIQHLEDLLKGQTAEIQKNVNNREIFERKDIEFKKISSELREQVIELREANDKLEKTNMDLKQNMSVLQQELSNSEDVQKDFVRLSQSLQMELEKIRAADTQVRWQEDDDIDHCASCKILFTVTKRKQHCRHCGTIYCDNCLSKKVQTGPNKKEVRVCDVCHTLLERNTAPYFSVLAP